VATIQLEICAEVSRCNQESCKPAENFADLASVKMRAEYYRRKIRKNGSFNLDFEVLPMGDWVDFQRVQKPACKNSCAKAT
jgi:hypothetical protein